MKKTIIQGDRHYVISYRTTSLESSRRWIDRTHHQAIPAQSRNKQRGVAAATSRQAPQLQLRATGGEHRRDNHQRVRAKASSHFSHLKTMITMNQRLLQALTMIHDNKDFRSRKLAAENCAACCLCCDCIAVLSGRHV
jgi:hypothetical protein